MASLNQLASIIQNTINGGYGVINENIHINQIKDEIVLTSRRLLDEYRRQGFFNPAEINAMYQRLDCVELFCRPLTECCEGIVSNRKVLYAKIPNIIDIRYIGTIEYDTQFTISYQYNIKSIGVGRFTKNKPIAWIRGSNEIILFNPPTYDIKYLSIDALFQDPREIYEFSCALCKNDEDNFPIPDKFADIITGKLIASYMNYKQIKPIQANKQSDLI